MTNRTFTNLTPVNHTIKLTLSGYEDWYGTVTVSTTLAPFAVKLTDSLGRLIQGHTIKWEIVSAPASATISSTITTTNVNGTTAVNFTLGTRVGTYTVIAKADGLIATFTAIAIHDLPTTLTLTPATCTLTADESQTYTARATDSDGNQWDEANIIWSTNDPTGTMSSNTYYPGKAGTWTITGTTTNGKSGTATVVVKPGAFVNLKIMLPATVTTNAAFIVTVSLFDSKGNPYSGVVNIANPTKSITPATIIVTEGTGTATATIASSPSGGTDTITVICGTVTVTGGDGGKSVGKIGIVK